MDAISRLDLPEAERTALINSIPVAFAVTYLVGVIGAAWVLAQLAPKLMRIDLAEECRKLEEKMRGGMDKQMSAWREFEFRAYAVDPGSRFVGRGVAYLESFTPGARIFVEQVRSRGEIVAAGDVKEFKPGDVLAVAGRRTTLVEVLEAPGSGLREVDDRELLDLPSDVVDVVVTSKAIDGRTLADFAQDETFRGVFLRKITRGGNDLGRLPDTVVHRGDVLTLVGSAASTARVVDIIGVADRATDVTDMLVVATGIVAGALIGLPALHIGGVEIGLSMPVGVLLGGLVCGWLRSVKPGFFGRIPGPTLWVFESLGLAGFVAVVGLNAGPDFVQGLRTSGVSLVVAGALTVSIALLIGVLVGRWLFKMHPGVLLGVCAGACTATPALAAIQESARSSVPSIGYGVAYAVGNVFLAIWGTVIVALLA
jgi:putative transport protein